MNHIMQFDIIDAAHSNLLRLAVKYDSGEITEEVFNMLQQKEFSLLTDRIEND